MKVQIKVLSGRLSGRTVVCSEPTIEIGRHPSSHLQFDPEQDLEVSTHHATLTRDGDRWLIRDRDSLNGTLVNGHSIGRDTPVDDTDQIRFGPDGPIVEFRLVPDSVPDGVVEPAHPLDHGAPNKPQQPSTAVPHQRAAQPPQRSTSGVTQRVRVEVGRQTRKLRALTIVLGTVLLAVVAVFIFDGARQRRLREQEAAAFENRTDSILDAATGAMEALQGQVEGLAATLRTSQEEVSSLQTALASARNTGNDDEARRLRRQLADASQALLYQQAAAYVDYGQIVEGNQRAVALIWVEFEPGEIYVGTAFAVRADGVLITSRHVVAGENGGRNPTRIAAKFADSDQVYQVRLLGLSETADIAALKVDIRGGVPTVKGLNHRADTLSQGDPVAIIGFPLGPDLPMSSSGQDRTIARSSFSAGTVSKNLPDVLQVDGYGAEGSSGSPIFDRNGEVVGVVFGGEAGSYGRVVLGVPAVSVLSLLNSLGL